MRCEKPRDLNRDRRQQCAGERDPDVHQAEWSTAESRWTVEAAIDENVPAPVITLSLLARMASRQSESFSAKVVAALRNQFGGHAVKSETNA